MTGDLNLMMKLRNQQIMSEIRKDANVQVAEDIRKMAELGYFDVEFNMYGCAYLNPVDNKMYYKVSSNAEDIYTFVEDAVLHNIYASNVVTESQKRPVPSGMKEMIAQDVKIELAHKLQNMYPKDFFSWLYHLAEQYESNTAAELLWQEAEQLEGVFDNEKLNQFKNLVQYAYSCRKINRATYQKLIEWIRQERSNMNDDLISKDLFEKTLYAIAYEQDNSIRFMENAQKEYICEKKNQIEEQGIFVTPIFEKTFWYNYVYRLSDVKKDFKTLIRDTINDSYIEKIKEIRGEKDQVIVKAFQKIIEETNKKWGCDCGKTMTRYAYRWGVI